jgi:large subunit ribosomal protein L23
VAGVNQERILQVLLTPHISEKSAKAADRVSQHVFRVVPDANKLEIKRAVEILFNVKVASVNMINMKGKRKRFGTVQGRRSAWKKAYVKLMPGYDIDFAGRD